jgi:hypothetical protein
MAKSWRTVCMFFWLVSIDMDTTQTMANKQAVATEAKVLYILQ